MDPTSIAAQAIGFLLPFLSKAGGHVMEGALGVVGDRMVALLKARLADDGGGTFTTLESEPGSDVAAEQLQQALLHRMTADPSFAEDLRALLVQADAAGWSNVQVGDGNKNAQIQGSNNSVSM